MPGTVITTSPSSSGKVPDVLYLPETMVDWPWPRAINPHYEEVKAASNAWFYSFKPFKPKSLYAFDKCDFARLASLAYPWSSKEDLRTGCDLMNLFFIVDEYTDVEPAPVVREMVDVVIDALNNPHKPRPEGEIILGEVARQFWALAIKTASPTSQKHMVESFTDYLESVVQQAEDRDENRFRTIDEYLENRRQNIGARPSFVPLELQLHLPDEAFYHPVVQELSVYITDLIILDNDIASYNKEQATGDDRHNILTLAMRQFNTDFEGAMDWVVQYHTLVETRFLDGLKRVPSFGPHVDAQLQLYIHGLANWPRCNDCWNFESGRYFGNKGREFQKTRRVPRLPKVVKSQHKLKEGKRENVDIPLVEQLELQ
ncbi:terpenoid synthase [Cristinia sonorae]|uniref:Terpene synthase n=1 Tax=Cristinia sonorae TaxID=1940300 RepID=A0A8K0UQW6_9AGAR|nr:terpenoid synthase [Cristinia sonorae]